jgi:hypothetical protein
MRFDKITVNSHCRQNRCVRFFWRSHSAFPNFTVRVFHLTAVSLYLGKLFGVMRTRVRADVTVYVAVGNARHLDADFVISYARELATRG